MAEIPAEDQAPVEPTLDDHLNHPRPDESLHHEFNPRAEEENEEENKND